MAANLLQPRTAKIGQSGAHPVRFGDEIKAAAGYAAPRTEVIFGAMATASTKRVVFKPRQVGTDWQVDAHLPGGMILCIKGFSTETRAQEWIDGRGAKTWRRQYGFSDE
jgi:hypothetical protein